MQILYPLVISNEKEYVRFQKFYHAHDHVNVKLIKKFYREIKRAEKFPKNVGREYKEFLVKELMKRFNT